MKDKKPSFGKIVATVLPFLITMAPVTANLLYRSKHEEYKGTYGRYEVRREVYKSNKSQKIWISGEPIEKWVYVTPDIQDRVRYYPQLFARDKRGNGKFEEVKIWYSIKEPDRKEGRGHGVISSVINPIFGVEDINDMASEAYKKNMPSTTETTLHNLVNQNKLKEVSNSATNKLNFWSGK